MLALSDILLLVLIPALLVCSAFFSGSETALFSLSGHQRLQMTRNRTLAGVIVVKLLAETRDLLITLLLGNMVVNVAYFVITTVLLIRLKHAYAVSGLLVAALGVVPLLMLIFVGEVLPKLVAARLCVKWSTLAALPLFVVHRAIGPLRGGLNVLVITPLARLIAPSTRPLALSAEEFATLLELSEQHGVIDVQEERLLQQVLELSQLKVRDLMTPRVRMVAFDLHDDPAELLDLFRKTRLSQLPVYVDDLDHVEGLVYARQMALSRPTTRQQVRAMVRSVLFVPELQRADRLLVDLRKRGTTVAIAVDEYGGTAGLITLEDVVEHMVGQIAGPFESADQQRATVVSLGVWRVSGELPIHDWVDAFEPVLRWQPGSAAAGVVTVGGLVMSRLGRLPHVGDRVEVGNVTIEVEKMAGSRVASLLLRLANAPQTEPATASTPSAATDQAKEAP